MGDANQFFRKVVSVGNKGAYHSYVCKTCDMKATRVDGKEQIFEGGKTDDAGTIANVTETGVILNSSGKFEVTHDACGIGTKWDATSKKCVVKLSDVCGEGTKKNSDTHKCIVDTSLIVQQQPITATPAPQIDQSLNNRDISALMLSTAALRATPSATVPESNEISTENLFNF